MEKMVRPPAVAGTFYEGTKKALLKQIEDCYTHPLGPGRLPTLSSKKEGKIMGLVSPHAGYLYSGPVAAWGFYQTVGQEIPEVVVILGPNHRGFGAGVAIAGKGWWQTPLGESQIEEELAEKITELSPFVREDEKAHQREHSLEVQVPFLQYSYGERFKIVPICMMQQDQSTSQKVGETLSEVLKGKNSLIIASTDFTHYQPKDIAKRQDKKALEAILSLSPKDLTRAVSRYRISMCGPGPVMAMLTATSLLGAKKATLLKYATSGDITGDYEAVVGYASVIVEK